MGKLSPAIYPPNILTIYPGLTHKIPLKVCVDGSHNTTSRHRKAQSPLLQPHSCERCLNAFACSENSSACIINPVPISTD